MRKLLLNVSLSALGALLMGSVVAWATNTTIGVTAGSGVVANLISFASTHVISEVGICDATTENQCGTVKAASTPAAATDPSVVVAISPNTPTPTNAATTAHTCSVAGYSEIGCLGQIDDDVKGPIAAGTNVIGFVSNDPCAQGTKLGAPINLTASGQIITGTSAKKTYICAIDVVTATAQNIALVEGTGTTCATNIFGLAGGTTAATGWNFSANSGIARGAGAGTIYSPSADTNGTAANVCLLLSSTGQTSGQISYVQQ